MIIFNNVTVVDARRNICRDRQNAEAEKFSSSSIGLRWDRAHFSGRKARRIEKFGSLEEKFSFFATWIRFVSFREILRVNNRAKV